MAMENQQALPSLDVWTSVLLSKSGAGRGGNGKLEAYGIKKLRELILELAVTGRLLSNDVSGWTESLLGEIGQWGSGGTPPKTHSEYYGGDIPWLVIGDLNDGLVTKAQTHITQLGLEKSSAQLVPEGTLLIAMYGSIGKLGIAGFPCATNQAIAFCNPDPEQVETAYLFLYLRAIREHLLSRGQGLAQQNISQKILKATSVRLPSLAEQHRIVAKVGELMALCDQLEQQQTDSLAAHQTLVETLLGTLTRVESQQEFSAAWARIASHFDTLFTTEANVDHLKQTILQLAVMGKLVPQDPNDEPASTFLKNIQAAKKVLIADGKIKREKLQPPIAADEKWCELPNGWEWVRFSDYAIDIATGPFGSMIHQSDYVVNGVPLVNPSHMIDDQIVPENGVAVSAEMAKGLESYSLADGDIVMARRGEVGRIALVTKKEAGWLCGTGSFVLRFSKHVVRDYLKLVFRCDFIRKYLAGEAVGTTMVNLNHGILKKMPFAVPPVAEQHRIVAKVEKLMALCDTLKARLADAQTTQLHLADAIVEQAVC